jgi:hypothetical protein
LRRSSASLHTKRYPTISRHATTRKEDERRNGIYEKEEREEVKIKKEKEQRRETEKQGKTEKRREER